MGKALAGGPVLNGGGSTDERPRQFAPALLPVSGDPVSSPADLRVNRILALLPERELARLKPDLTFVDLRHHDMIYPPGAEVAYAYFPLSAVMSVIATDSDGRGVEAASVGREGIVGLAGALGASSTIGEVINQVSGSALRIPIDPLRREIECRETLSGLVERYTIALLAQISQSLVCNRHHPIEARTARWLLATHDRVGEDSFVLTQDFLAIMLGLTRPQVSIAAAALRRRGLIDYRRGRITIADRAGLEAAVCECYGIIQAEFTRLLRADGLNGWHGVGG
jgi:CRP-like cAMP-binding protein